MSNGSIVFTSKFCCLPKAVPSADEINAFHGEAWGASTHIIRVGIPEDVHTKGIRS